MKTVRVVLQESVSEADIDSAAWDNEWSLVKTIKGDENTPHEVIYRTEDEQAFIHYIEDFYIDMAYLVVRSDEPEKAIEEICSYLPIYDKGEIFEMLKKATKPEEFIQGIYYAGLISPQQYDAEFFELFKQVLSNQDPGVRLAVITAIGYAGWPEFKEILESLIITDSDPEVRQDAEDMLEGLKLHVLN
ncbi:MAG TPA: hypothetical protein DCL61_11445 [Cyanobacteria bacterium UBA12227]|nr:hypothetical protein [Cyanobacteria bacterium UBA12227]HAX85349.1 hypothetical protein [Cyanobacteria bacterium UBA11370]HBY79075.1 hypothetical protein [Cyanobacteria bacterium UBA11148]